MPSALAVDAESRGLYLIAKLMDRMTIVVNPSTGKGVSLTMEKTTAASPRLHTFSIDASDTGSSLGC